MSMIIDDHAQLDALFGDAGPLAACLRDFAPRPEQLAMADAVAEAIDRRTDLVVEAGTGTGKTLAYLVPLLVAGRPALISTGTRTLQDQLFHRDLPMLAGALGRPLKLRLLKGRSNYLCDYRLEQVQSRPPRGAQASAELRRATAWARTTRTGDIAELTGIPEASSIWSRITSTADNCLGSRCPRLADCHVARARQAAREADVVVVNHHLLLADLGMKDEGFGELLPGVEVVVVDEAHHFPQVAQAFFTRSLGSRQPLDLLSDLRAEILDSGLLLRGLDERADAIGSALERARELLPHETDKLNWDDVDVEFGDALEDLEKELQGLAGDLDQAADAGAGARRCRDRCAGLARTLSDILQADEDQGLRWLRPTSRGFVVNLTPLDTADQVQGWLRSAGCSWIFTSATLAVGDDFGHFTSRLGLAGAATRRIPSPFDFGRMARLYLPADMPDPASPGYTAAVVAAARPALQASGGRAFLLFTSHRALKEAARLLENAGDCPYPLLVQGSAPRSRLLAEFARLDAAVLLGTSTFWEGVDIRGPGLVLVVIDRLPFASPGDPMLAARLEAIRRQGGNPFRDHQLPHAVLALKQGVGRLIRDYQDYGVVMICDPRITGRAYGRVFLESLPPMPVIRDPADLQQFFASFEQ